MLKIGMKKDKITLHKLLDNKFIEILCDCGKIKKILRGNWKNHKTCGDCGRGLRLNIKPGDKYNFLTVLKENGKLHRSIAWECKCDCGNLVKLRSSDLKKGYVKSCGCKNKGMNSHLYLGCGNLSGYYWSTIIHGAKKRKLAFKITIEEAWELFNKQCGKCAISGINIFLESESSRLRTQTASLDRIDSSKGYTTDNIQWVHKEINMMKQHYSQNIFVEWCKIVTNYQLIKERCGI